MNPISYTLSATKILTATVNGRDNVISRVYWEIVLSDGTFETRAGGCTDLYPTFNETFVPSSELNEEQVCRWVLEQLGGSTFVNMLIEQHGPEIERQRAESKMIEITLPV